MADRLDREVNDLQILWNRTVRERWDAAHAAQAAALQQAWAYGESLRTTKVGVQRGPRCGSAGARWPLRNSSAAATPGCSA